MTIEITKKHIVEKKPNPKEVSSAVESIWHYVPARLTNYPNIKTIVLADRVFAELSRQELIGTTQSGEHVLRFPTASEPRYSEKLFIWRNNTSIGYPFLFSPYVPAQLEAFESNTEGEVSLIRENGIEVILEVCRS